MCADRTTGSLERVFILYYYTAQHCLLCQRAPGRVIQYYLLTTLCRGNAENLTLYRETILYAISNYLVYYILLCTRAVARNDLLHISLDIILYTSAIKLFSVIRDLYCL